jgi:hypothetical protein
LILRGSLQTARYYTWSSNINYWIDNKLNCLIYLILFYLELWSIFRLTYLKT